MENTNHLFTPLKLKNITLPTRAVRSATEIFCSYPDAHTHPYEFELYKELSKEPIGLIISAHTCVSPEGRSNLYQNAIWSDEFLSDARNIADASQAYGVPAVMQLGHGGIQAKDNNGGLKVYTPETMTEAEIHEVVKAFGQAAKRAVSAGFSGVMLHTAHLYLLSRFFYPCFNHRTDKYGGCTENRFRIIREIFEEIKSVCGDATPVFMKINGDDLENTEEYHSELVAALNISSKLGMDAVEISGWTSARQGIPEKPYFIENIKRLKNETDIPLIAVGGIRTPSDIEDLLNAGADAVSMSRPFLQNPHILTELAAGRASGCTGCCFCFTPLKHNGDKTVRCPHRKNK